MGSAALQLSVVCIPAKIGNSSVYQVMKNKKSFIKYSFGEIVDLPKPFIAKILGLI